MKGNGPGPARKTEGPSVPQTPEPGQRNGGQARLLAIAAAILFSTGGAAIKTGAFSALQVSSVRSGIATLALLAFVGGRRQLNGPVLATAVAYAACLTLFVGATKLTTSASAIFLQSSAPLYLLVIGPWLLKERLQRRDVLLRAGDDRRPGGVLPRTACRQPDGTRPVHREPAGPGRQPWMGRCSGRFAVFSPLRRRRRGDHRGHRRQRPRVDRRSAVCVAVPSGRRGGLGGVGLSGRRADWFGLPVSDARAGTSPGTGRVAAAAARAGAESRLDVAGQRGRSRLMGDGRGRVHPRRLGAQGARRAGERGLELQFTLLGSQFTSASGIAAPRRRARCAWRRRRRGRRRCARRESCGRRRAR